MKCPMCGNELRRSDEEPTKGLCDSCKAKFDWTDDDSEQGYTDYSNYASGLNDYSVNDTPVAPIQYSSPKKRKKHTGLIVVGMCFMFLLGSAVGAFAVIAKLSGGADNAVAFLQQPESDNEYIDATAKESKKDTREKDGDDTKDKVKEEKKDKSSDKKEKKDTANVSSEFKNALRQAETYSDMMHMSKKGIYDQLTSEYGGQFPKDAAQYAVDNVDADWKANALATAENYSDTMHMSKKSIYDQLTSEHGEQFTTKEAQYAIDNIKADWKANALETAKSYQENMNMSIEDIRNQLTSEYGEQFTKEEADYAISHIK